MEVFHGDFTVGAYLYEISVDAELSDDIVGSLVVIVGISEDRIESIGVDTLVQRKVNVHRAGSFDGGDGLDDGATRRTVGILGFERVLGAIYWQIVTNIIVTHVRDYYTVVENAHGSKSNRTRVHFRCRPSKLVIVDVEPARLFRISSRYSNT